MGLTKWCQIGSATWWTKSMVVKQTQTTVYKHELCSHSSFSLCVHSCRKGEEVHWDDKDTGWPEISILAIGVSLSAFQVVLVVKKLPANTGNIKDMVGCFERTASKHVYYLGWNRSPAQAGCMRQVLGAGALGRLRGIGWRRRWEGGSGWGIHVYPWLIHVSVWQKPLQ